MIVITTWQTNQNVIQLWIQKRVIKGIIIKQEINIRLEKDVIQTLDEYTYELDKTRTTLIKKAIELYFDKLDEMIADKRIDNLKAGQSKVTPLEEVFKKAGIDV